MYIGSTYGITCVQGIIWYLSPTLASPTGTTVTTGLVGGGGQSTYNATYPSSPAQLLYMGKFSGSIMDSIAFTWAPVTLLPLQAFPKSLLPTLLRYLLHPHLHHRLCLPPILLLCLRPRLLSPPPGPDTRLLTLTAAAGFQSLMVMVYSLRWACQAPTE